MITPQQFNPHFNDDNSFQIKSFLISTAVVQLSLLIEA